MHSLKSFSEAPGCVSDPKCIQGFQGKRKFVQQKAAAVIIQKHLRAWQEGRLQFKKYNETRRAVIKLQALIRGYLVRKKVGIIQIKTMLWM